MKFKDYELVKDQYGFEFAKNDIMKGSGKKPCSQCYEPTEFIEVFIEGYFCSDECVSEWYKRYNELVQE